MATRQGVIKESYEAEKRVCRTRLIVDMIATEAHCFAS